MAAGDPSYTIALAGSAATSIAGVHNLFGLYNSLSTLNADESLHVQMSVVGTGELLVGVTGNISNNIGYKIHAGLSMVDLPPMRAAYASQLQMSRAVSNTDASHNFIVWARRP